MPQQITTITLSMPLHLGQVNCYLVQAGSGYVLIDSGPQNRRAALEEVLRRAGCAPGNLSLIVLTHGDFDHTGNATYLRDQFGTRLAMHRDDAGMAEQGDMFAGRKSGGALLRRLAPVLFGFSPANRFRPDVYLNEGDSLVPYGLEAQVLHLLGHSSGSIAILTATGDLFCGDLLENRTRPALGSIIDDRAAAEASVSRLKGLSVRTVYPGHGQPFAMQLLA